jgi:hypothetical protein
LFTAANVLANSANLNAGAIDFLTNLNTGVAKSSHNIRGQLARPIHNIGDFCSVYLGHPAVSDFDRSIGQ